MKKVILYIAMSQDGFIAREDGSIDFLPTEIEQDGIDDYNNLLTRVDSIAWGYNVYKQVVGWGLWNTTQVETDYVFYDGVLDDSNITQVNKSVKDFFEDIKDKNPNKALWLMGGSMLIKQFVEEDLIDEVQLTVIPVSIEKGIPLWTGKNPIKDLNPISVEEISGNKKYTYRLK